MTKLTAASGERIACDKGIMKSITPKKEDETSRNSLQSTSKKHDETSKNGLSNNLFRGGFEDPKMVRTDVECADWDGENTPTPKEIELQTTIS